MQILSKSAKVFFVLLALSSKAFSAEAPNDKALISLVAAEKGFAQMAVEKGVRDAFVANLADDAIVFNPGPVKGKELYLKRPASEARLTWQPIFADVADAGDIGYTTGPWEFRAHAGDAKASGFGQFVSVWKKQAEGDWKVILDGGIENPAPVDKQLAVEILPNEYRNERKTDLKAARGAFAAAEKEFSDASAKDAEAALIDASAENIRIFREGRFPAVGRDAARLMLGYDHGKMTAKRIDGGISRSGDLAYSYGEYSNERQDGIERGYYVTIWKLSVGGDWKLAVDVRKAQPPEEKKAGQ